MTDSAREVIARWLAGRRFTRTPASTQAYRRYLAAYRAMLSAARGERTADTREGEGT